MKQFSLPEAYFKETEHFRTHTKEELTEILKKFAQEPVRPNTYLGVIRESERGEALLEKLGEEGVFEDVPDTAAGWELAIKRLTYLIVHNYHRETAAACLDAVPEKVRKGLIYYGEKELGREDKGPVRFHASCFAIPNCAVNVFYALLPLMLEIEAQKEQWVHFYNVVCELMLQAWLLPVRQDETQSKPFSVERFQNHVWWQGGNALAYRPSFYTAFCFRDSRLIDILGQVIIGFSASRASHGQPSFWTEGICADGFGWGHGAQAYNDGYPVDALREVFYVMKHLKDTSYAYIFREMDWDNIIHFISGISWSSYGKFVPPMMGRQCFRTPDFVRESTTEMMRGFAKDILTDAGDYLSDSQTALLKRVLEVGELEIEDTCGQFHGTRYFFNNDTLISKNKDRYFYFNMASRRCKGVECAHEMADTRNFYIRDGSYVLLKQTKDFEHVKGTFNPSHFPGTTERDLKKEEIIPETNWSGYNSIHNFAGGIGRAAYGVAGFIYEKLSNRQPDGAGVIRDDYTKEMMGVRAYKSAFVYEDLFVFLGSGIEDNMPEYGRTIRTTVNNTVWKDAVYVDAQGKRLGDVTKKDSIKGEKYLKNDGILYGAWKDGNTDLLVQPEIRRTDWAYLSFMNAAVQEEELPVMELSIDHGTAPKAAEYQYWLCTDEHMTPKEAEASMQVLCNTTKAQAVIFEDRMLMAVCYEPVKITTDTYCVEVSEPCVLMVEQEENRTYHISICDARQDRTLSAITVRMERLADGHKKQVDISLPKEELCGSTADADVIMA